MTSPTDDRQTLAAILRAWVVIADNVPEPEAALGEVYRRADLYVANGTRYVLAGRPVVLDGLVLMQAFESVADDVRAGRLV
jgi:hypothetical protein